VADVVIGCYRNREALRGVRIVKQAPYLRHFTAEFETIGA
jgi:tryptophanase